MRRRQVLGDIQDGLLLVLERRADVQSAPRQRAGLGVGVHRRHLVRASSLSDGRRPTCRAIASKSPPRVSVAEVRTAVRSFSTSSRNSPATVSGAIRSSRPNRSRSTSQTTSRSFSAATRSATSKISLTAPLDCRFAPSGSSSLSSASCQVGVHRGPRRGPAPPPPGHRRSPPRSGPHGSRRGRPAARPRHHQVVGVVVVDEPPGPLGGPLDHLRRQLVAGGAGDLGGQLVRLVDDHHVVLGQDRAVLERVDRQQRVVGDHDVGLAGFLLGLLGETLLAVRALLRAEALPRGDRDLLPGLVLVGGRVVAVAGLAVEELLLGPVAQLDHLLADRAGRWHVDQHAVVVGRAFADAVQAGVVVAALLDRVRRAARQELLGGVEQRRDIPVDQLGLQRQGRRRDDHPALLHRMDKRGHQIAERLAGTGPCLHQQMRSVVHGSVHRFGHLHLARTRLTTDSGDRGLQEFPHFDTHRITLAAGPDNLRSTASKPVDNSHQPPATSPVLVRLPHTGDLRQGRTCPSSPHPVQGSHSVCKPTTGVLAQCVPLVGLHPHQLPRTR